MRCLKMRIEESLKKLCIDNGISLSELARRLNKSPQALSQKISRGTFSISDLDEIAMVTNCKLECNFVLMNGEKIKITN